MTLGLWISVLLAAGLVVFIAAPLFRREGPTSAAAEADLSSARELQSQQEMLLSSLKDLEDDRATDKIGEEDYAELHARLSAEAIDVMRRLDEDEARRVAEAAPNTVRHPGSRPPSRSR